MFSWTAFARMESKLSHSSEVACSACLPRAPELSDHNPPVQRSLQPLLLHSLGIGIDVLNTLQSSCEDLQQACICLEGGVQTHDERRDSGSVGVSAAKGKDANRRQSLDSDQRLRGVCTCSRRRCSCLAE